MAFWDLANIKRSKVRKFGFSLKTVFMLAEQFLNHVEYLHSKNYVHQDLKPENFLMGIGESDGLVYLADFGVTKRYNPIT